MLKALLLLLMNLALAAMATAQNLVPNPSFEDTARCGEYDLVRLQMPPWFNPNIATPDVYDNNLTAPCGLPWDPSNPDVQDQGYQQARTGTRFAGAFHWYGPEASDSKDYVMVKLLSPLSQGSWYEVGLFVSRPEGFVYATDRIGVHFSADSINEDIPSTLPLDPQVELFAPNGGYLTDAVDWVELRDTFQATGVERYMVIGSFRTARR